MVEVFAPRRGESVVDSNGLPTTRFFEYLESVSSQSNLTLTDTEIDSSSINLGNADTALIKQEIADIRSQMESIRHTAEIAQINKRIDQLFLLVN